MNSSAQRRRKADPIVCRCNNINRSTIETAIVEGCDTMNKIFDATTAGVGACGGTCRRQIVPLLNDYLQTGKFPEKLPPREGSKKSDET